MSIRVGISGFGRMGRNLFRALYTERDIEVVAINDIAEPKSLEYLLRYDSLHGGFPEPVHCMDGYLYANGRRIPLLQEEGPGAPWYDYGVDVVVEATSRYRKRAELERHLESGADRVILTTPPVDELDAIHIKGVTGELARSHRLIAAGSSTSGAVAIMLAVLDRAFGVEEAFMTSVHAYTTEQSLIDVPTGNDLRLSRAAVENIVPVQTWCDYAIPKLFPKLEGRFHALKLNVPVPDSSCVDLVATLAQDVQPDEINAVFKSASHSTMDGVLEWTDEPIVSSDVSDSPASCVFDSLATMVVDGRMTKTLGWYSQGGGLAHRIVDLIRQLGPIQ